MTTLSAAVIAEILGVDYTHATWLLRTGRIRGRKIRGVWAVEPQDLGKYLEERANG